MNNIIISEFDHISECNHNILCYLGGSMTDSMIWNAMTTSMQLAQECLKEGPSSGEEQAEASPPFEGLESFAQTIESGEYWQKQTQLTH